MPSELTPERRAAIRALLDGEQKADWRDHLHNAYVDDVPDLLAALDASEAEVARLRERVSFGNHKRHQCEDNLGYAEARIKALEAAGDRLTKHLDHSDQNCAPMYGCFCGCLDALEAWRSLRGTGDGEVTR